MQFNHRSLAYASIASAAATFLAARKNPLLWASLSPTLKGLSHGLAAIVVAQAGLGIATLMMYVPVELGSLHQTGAVAVWTTALLLANFTRGAAARGGVNRAILRQLEKAVAKKTVG